MNLSVVTRFLLPFALYCHSHAIVIYILSLPYFIARIILLPGVLWGSEPILSRLGKASGGRILRSDMRRFIRPHIHFDHDLNGF